eukprot:TRINITY_DN3461_c0_g1_i6.p1 TRINITY_DN3461_c0_g1~~TRINITY_DN3461_c0_g1_i6.p1  ORF type:complete len:138 (+),score=27.66 TRINITY_DN3461_c0_g1_i6:108-521(+)
MQSTSNDQTNTTITGADPVEELAASAVAIRGKSVSGRTWKKTTKRASSQINVKPLRSSWQKKVSEKERLKQVKLHENLLKEAVRQQKEVRKKKVVVSASRVFHSINFDCHQRKREPEWKRGESEKKKTKKSHLSCKW